MPQNQSHRRNHYVPLFMIRYWEVTTCGMGGVHVYSLSEGRSFFQRRSKRHPYPFAMAEDLYVPVIEGDRDLSMEAGWLNVQEAALSELVRGAHQRSYHLACSPEDYTKISMALFALEQRSRFNLEQLRRAIEASPALRQIASASPERDAQRLVLENLIHIVTELHGRHWPLSLTFLHSGASSYIITDRPGFNDPGMAERVVVLTNKVAVVYQKTDAQATFRHVDASAPTVDLINRMVAIRAREWIVAEGPDELGRWAQVTKSEEANTYRASERIGVVRPVCLSSGWSFRADP